MKNKTHIAFIKSAAALLIILILPKTVFAFDQEQWGYGTYIKGGNYTVDDSEASTEETSSAAIGIKIMFKPEARGQRYFAAVDAVAFDLAASASGNVNAEVSSVQFAGGYEQRISFTRKIKMWLGAALSVNSTKVENRFLITSDGYLERRLSDLKESGVGVQLNADTFFDVSARGDYQIGLGLYADYQGSDAIEAFGLKMTLQKK